MFGGSDFLRVERHFTIGQRPKIWGNFSKICIKINKNLHNYWENSRKNAKIAQIFITSLYSFLKIFSFITSYNYSMLFCIEVSICEPISIRYTLKSLIQYGKIAKS